METATVYASSEWRELPRTQCLIEVLFGDAAGECVGHIHRHHVDPDDPWSRTFEVCAGHHPRVHAALRKLLAAQDDERRCPHRPGTHRYPHALAECERKVCRQGVESQMRRGGEATSPAP